MPKLPEMKSFENDICPNQSTRAYIISPHTSMYSYKQKGYVSWTYLEIKIEYLLLITFQMTQIIILFHVKSSFCDLHDVNVKTTVDLLPRALKQNWVLSCHTFAVVLNWYFKKNKQDVTVLILCWCLSLTIIFILFMDTHLLQIGNLKYMYLFESC